MAAPLDLKRIAVLEGLMGPDLGSVLHSITQNMSDAIEQADTALAAGQLSDAAYAAHCCRNDALMVGAGQLQEALTALETCTRSEQLEPSRSALERVHEVWPGTRAEIERAAAEGVQ